MKRKTMFRILIGMKLVCIALLVLVAAELALAGQSTAAVAVISNALWIVLSCLDARESYRLRDAAVALFNMIKPENAICDDDLACFKVVDKNGKRIVEVDVSRDFQKKEKRHETSFDTKCEARA